MHLPPILATAAAALALAAPSLAQATVIRSQFTPLGGTSWSVALTVVNDGAPASISGFTVYFPQATFSNLQLTATPTGWDPLVVQPDPALPAAGFLDYVGLTPASSIGAGQFQGGFVGRFTLLGGGTPAALPFTINDAAFNVLFAGTTVVTVVPEPASALLAMLGLATFGTAAARRGRRAAGSGPSALSSVFALPAATTTREIAA